MEPVEHAEPDVQCMVGNQRFGIAVKRVKNVKRLEERVRGAAKQIERCNLPGIIALDVSLALNPGNKRVWHPMSDETFRDLYHVAIHKFIELHHDDLQEWVRRRGVRGIVFHDHQVRLGVDGHWWLESMTYRLCTARVNQRRNCEFAAFEGQYVRGLSNLVQLGM
jgi:hypothetical protein